MSFYGPYLILDTEYKLSNYQWICFEENEGAYNYYEFIGDSWQKKDAPKEWLCVYSPRITRQSALSFNGDSLLSISPSTLGGTKIVNIVENFSSETKEWVKNTRLTKDIKKNPKNFVSIDRFPAIEHSWITNIPVSPSLPGEVEQQAKAVENQPIDVDAALELLQVTSLEIICNPETREPKDLEMLIWIESQGIWKYKVGLLGETISGDVDDLLITKILSLTPKNLISGYIDISNVDFRHELSSSYLKLSWNQQSNSAKKLSRYWPECNEQFSTQEIINIFEHVLHGTSLDNIGMYEHEIVLNNCRDQLRTFFFPSTINNAFTDLYTNDDLEPTIKDVIIFYQRLILATIKALGGENTQPLPQILEKYSVKIGNLAEQRDDDDYRITESYLDTIIEEYSDIFNIDDAQDNHEPSSQQIKNSFFFASIYFKICMLSLIIISALTLVALILSTTNLAHLVPTFLTNLAPIVFKTLLGASISVGIISTAGLCVSIMASNKFCMFHEDDKNIELNHRFADYVSNTF